jgi:tetratricopeptide (TPR) repeat protein
MLLRLMPPLGLFVLLTACRTAGDYVERGDALAKEGNHVEAILNYRKALQKQESMGEVHYKLALSARALGDNKQAATEFVRAAQLIPGREDVQAAYGEVLLSSYLSSAPRSKALYDQLHQLSDAMLKQNTASLPGLRTKGTLAIIDQNPKDAIAYLQRANQAKPHDPLTVELLMQAFFQSGESASATQLGWNTLTHNPSSLPLYSLLYKHYYSTRNNDEAERVLREQLRHNGNLTSPYIDLAAFYHTANRIGDRDEILGQLLANRTLSKQAHVAAAGFYKAVSELDKSLALYREGCRSHPESRPSCLQGEVSVLLLQSKRADALRVAENALKEFPQDHELRATRAFILSESEDKDKIDVAITELRSLAQAKPESANLHYLLGQALLRKGLRVEAGREFRSALKINPRFELALYGLSELSLLDKQHSDAKQYADALLAINPKQNKARLIRAISLRELGNLAEAATDIEQVAKSNSGSSEPLLEMGRLRFAQNNLIEAEKVFLRLHKAGQPDIRPIEGLVNTYLVQNKIDIALKLLQSELALQPNNPALWSLHSSVALLAGDFKTATASARKLLAMQAGTVEGHLRLGDTHLQAGKPAEALSEFQAVQKIDPEHKQAAAMVALALEAGGETADAIDAYRRAIALQPENPALANNLAFLLAEKGELLGEALRMAEAATQRSRRPEFADTLGWVLLKKGDVDRAIAILRDAAKQQPKQPVIQYHLGAALAQKGDRSGAQRHFEAALALRPDPATTTAIRKAISNDRP